MVICLSDDGEYGPLLRTRGLDVYCLGFRSRLPSPLRFLELVTLLRGQGADVVQTWMYHADLIGGLASWVAGTRKIVWGIRHSTLNPRDASRRTIWIARLLAKLSWWLPSRIAVCAARAIEFHQGLGYDRFKMRLIPNGYDLADFVRRPKEGEFLRDQWCAEPNVFLLGLVGRYSPDKDHLNLLKAISILRLKNIKFRCVLVGKGVDTQNASLLKKILSMGLENDVLLMGSRNDIPSVMSALDLLVLSSSSEAFPNVVAEAMACETPCVVTDVGDAALIVGETGWIVPPRNPRALASAIERAIQCRQTPEWFDRCVSARDRIKRYFSVEKMISGYHSVWGELT